LEQPLERREQVTVWRLKIGIQFVLAIVPGGERLNYLLQRLNRSHDLSRIPNYIDSIGQMGPFLDFNGSVVMEIGTGWRIISPLVFYLLGAERIFTYDHVRHLRFQPTMDALSGLEAQLDRLHDRTGVPLSVLSERLNELKSAPNLEDLLERSHIVYVAPGDGTHTDLPDQSVDLVYSYYVMEHLPPNVIDDLMVETKRILRPNGIAFHVIGLMDHYANASNGLSRVNFLRYPAPIWSFFTGNRISYHNRLREQQFIDVFQRYGAEIRHLEHRIDPNDVEAAANMRVDKTFEGLTPEQLAVHHTEIVLSF
jgi:SAM-dependent methyltransferase